MSEGIYFLFFTSLVIGMMLAVLIPICMLVFPKTSIHVLEKFIHYNTECNEFTLKRLKE